MGLTKAKKAERAAEKAKRDEMFAANQAIAAKGTCPTCGRKLKRNLSLTGWWQCSQLGAVGFRAEADKPSCDFQMFTE